LPADRDPLPYEEITDPSYGQVAAGNFTVERVRKGVLVLRGSCPRCGAALEVPLVGTVFDGMRTIFGRRRSRTAAPVEHVEPLICTCEDEHPNRPQGRTGCGAYWTVVLTTDPT
jgi:hypothetical protein